ncbi:MAG TPA: tail-specific protease, partial [Desulfobacteraceae bacterium]|nr:tail-specific protease [Desulfobacteraceae bacterium]
MRLNRLLASGLLILLMAGPGYAKFVPIRFDVSRNRLIEFMLSSQLPAEHFSRKSLADVAPAAFDLYLRQLDARKRFLLKANVLELRALAVHLADN